MKFDIVSLEHIGSQKDFDEACVGNMGNLLPLCFSINEACKSNPLSKKIDEYRKSRLEVVKQFVAEKEATSGSWSKDDVDSRTLRIANLTYSQM